MKFPSRWSRFCQATGWPFGPFFTALMATGLVLAGYAAATALGSIVVSAAGGTP